MRVAEADFVRIGQPQAMIKLHRVFLGFHTLLDAILDRRFGMLIDNPVRRIERGGSRLRHIGNA